MTGRVVLAAVLGGLLMFIWGAIAHMVLPIGEMGIKELPAEEPVLTALRTNIPQDGMYWFPAMKEDMTEEQWTERAKAGPTGLMVYRVHGEGLTPRQLITEFVSNVFACLVGAWLLTQGGRALASYGARVLFFAALGVVSWLSIEVSYWNWYTFPGEYALGQLIDQVAGFTLSGLAVGKLVQPASI